MRRKYVESSGAREILTGLERDELSRGGRPTLSGSPGDPQSSQLGLFAVQDPGTEAAVTRRLREVDVNATTPLQALALLEELKKMTEEG